MLLGNGAVGSLADPAGDNLCSRMLRLKLFPNPGLDSLDFSRGEGGADLCYLFLAVGVIGGEPALLLSLLLFLGVPCGCPSLRREELCVGLVVLLEPAEGFDVKVRLARFGESVINEPAHVFHGAHFKQGGGEGGLLLREAELVCIVRSVELLIEVAHDLLRLLYGVFIDGKGEGKLRLHSAPVEMLVVFEEAAARTENKVKSVSSGILLYFIALDEARFFQRLEVFAELLLLYFCLVPKDLKPSEPRTAYFLVVFPEGKVLRPLRAVDIREVKVEVLVERRTDRPRFSIRPKLRQKV
jgi:hypothetical protein